MNVGTYVKVSAINLGFLFAGMLLGPVVVRSDYWLGVVHAQSTPKAAAKADSTPARDPNAEYVQPTISAGAALFGTLISHRVATDMAVVNDFDLLKLHENTFKALAAHGTISPTEIQQIINSSKIARPIRIEQRPPDAPKP